MAINYLEQLVEQLVVLALFLVYVCRTGLGWLRTPQATFLHHLTATCSLSTN